MRRLGEAMWIANILLVGVAAFFGAEGVGAVARVALSRGMPVASQGARARAPASDPRAVTSDGILARNPFDSVTGSLLPRARADGEAGGPADPGYDPFRVPACADVRAVVIAELDDRSASLAAFEIPGAASVLRREGGEVGKGRVERIAADRVFLREGDRLCQAELFAPPAPPKADHAPAAPTARDPGAIDPRIPQGIERLAPGRYRIDRRVVEMLLEDQAEIMKGGMMRPEKEGDRTVGVRLFAVRPDRLFGLLGLQDGDVMRSINGYEFSSPERMLEAYAHLREATELRVDFSRGGQPQSSSYAIQ